MPNKTKNDSSSTVKEPTFKKELSFTPVKINIAKPTSEDSCCTDGSCSAPKEPPLKKEFSFTPIKITIAKPASEDSCCADGSCSAPKEPTFKKSLNLTVMPSAPASTNACCTDDGCSAEAGINEDRQNSKRKMDINRDAQDYRIQGMDCPACALTIEKSLRKLEGVKNINVNYSTAKMQLVKEDSLKTEEVQNQLKKLGYTGEPIEKDGNKQTYRIEGMDCGACAVSIEKHLNTLPYVKDVKVNFSTGKMQIVHDASPEEIMKEVSKAGYKASPVSNRKQEVEPESKKPVVSLTTLSGILLAFGFLGSYLNLSPILVTALYAAVILISGYKPARSAYYAIKSGSLDMNVLMTVAALGAVFIGEWLEGATVVWLFAFGTMLQTKSVERTRESIRNLMDLAPSEAWVKVGQDLIRKPVEDITVGDTIIIKAGEKIPLDGDVIEGTSSVNQAPITGESIPVDKGIGDSVYAGTVNESGSLEVKVTKLVEDTTISRIIHLVEEVQEKKAPTQDFVDRFARIYTPIVFVLALVVMVLPPLFGWGTWSEWLYKGLELLVVACPCALVISTPVAIVSAIGNAAKNGVLIKGGTFLELAGSLKAIAFDKTGTLTEGKPKVAQIITEEGTENELLAIARTIEEHSKHPIALTITKHATEQNIQARNGKDFKAIVGKGAQATIEGVEYFAGNLKLFREFNVPLQDIGNKVTSLQDEGNTIVIVGTKTKILGIIAVADSIRDITVKALTELKEVGINQVVMLTGDNEGTAEKIAAQAKMDRYFAELLPEDKVNAIKQLQKEGNVVGMVGDGINDAPALATADLGIAMGGAGSDTAMETADIILMADNLEKLPHTIKLSRKALRIIKQNIWFSIIIKVVALVLIFPGWLTLWLAVMSDTGAALIVILNSMRLLRLKG